MRVEEFTQSLIFLQNSVVDIEQVLDNLPREPNHIHGFMSDLPEELQDLHRMRLGFTEWQNNQRLFGTSQIGYNPLDHDDFYILHDYPHRARPVTWPIKSVLQCSWVDFVAGRLIQINTTRIQYNRYEVDIPGGSRNLLKEERLELFVSRKYAPAKDAPMPPRVEELVKVLLAARV